MRLKQRKQSRFDERGSVIMEFGIIAPFLMMMLAGSFTLGMSVNRSIQASNVNRNAIVLMTRKVDLSRSENQKMLIRSAAGLKMNIAGTYTPDPNGQGVVILTKVIRVGPVACSLGISGWNGNAATCPNYGEYVMAQRIGIGNTGRWGSALGNPTSSLASDGSVSDADVANVSTNRSSGFKTTVTAPGFLYLEIDTYTYVGELFADMTDLNIMSRWLTVPNIMVRNFS